MKGKRKIDRENGLVIDSVIFDEYESRELGEAWGDERVADGAIMQAQSVLAIYAIPGKWEAFSNYGRIRVDHTYNLTEGFKEDSDVLLKSDSLE